MTRKKYLTDQPRVPMDEEGETKEALKRKAVGEDKRRQVCFRELVVEKEEICFGSHSQVL